ncbi:MAG TPA: MBL fold metallo-hydrolase [Actinomycetota bacterium]|jgi:glyoxylase-like metal-dependent hydrolase (beta-lactamase superfamily II)
MSLEIFWHAEVGPLLCNCYVVGDATSKDAIVVDPGGDANEIVAAIEERNLTITAIVATHAHFDHLIAAEVVRAHTGSPLYLHEGDRPLLDWFEESGLLFLGTKLPPPPEIDSSPVEGDRLVAGTTELVVVDTPGHSPGSISLVHDAAIFSGDVLFADSIGRSDLPGGDPDTLVASIHGKLFDLDDDVPVYPGHGPATTIGRERAFNPFVGSSGGMWPPPS